MTIFFTFTRPFLPAPKCKEKITFSRSFSSQNLNNFKAALSGTDWSHVTNLNSVDDAYDTFWSTYLELYEMLFPKKQICFNRNIHKKSPFMTNGLLISRNTKNQLFKNLLTDNCPANVQKYKQFKQTYCKVLHVAKKLYFQKKLRDNVKIRKKTWETLNEVLGKSKNNATVEKINIDGQLSTDPSEISNHFNSFFTQIGKNISNSIPPIQ